MLQKCEARPINDKAAHNIFSSLIPIILPPAACWDDQLCRVYLDHNSLFI